MNFIDLHCDTLYEMLSGEKQQNLKKNTLKVDLEKLRKADCAAQFFACFICMDEFLGKSRYDQAYEYVRRMVTCLKKQIWMYPEDLSLACNGKDLRKNQSENKISAFLTLEEGGVISGKIERIQELYDMGIRLITLTWNYENCIGYPNSADQTVMRKGLKPFGIDVVTEMERLGVLVDVSHLSEGGFWDVIRIAKHPPVASHSNARALLDHPRNLSDEQIRALASKGGIAGLNFYPHFLGTEKDSMIEKMVRHIQHMFRTGGEEFVAVGTDFDGFHVKEEMEIRDVGEVGRLWDALEKKGFTQRQIDKIRYGNARRLIETEMK